MPPLNSILQAPAPLHPGQPETNAPSSVRGSPKEPFEKIMDHAEARSSRPESPKVSRNHQRERSPIRGDAPRSDGAGTHLKSVEPDARAVESKTGGSDDSKQQDDPPDNDRPDGLVAASTAPGDGLAGVGTILLVPLAVSLPIALLAGSPEAPLTTTTTSDAVSATGTSPALALQGHSAEAGKLEQKNMAGNKPLPTAGLTVKAQSQTPDVETSPEADAPDMKADSVASSPTPDAPAALEPHHPGPDLPGKNDPAASSTLAPEPIGTSAAKQDLAMKKADKMIKTAGAIEQDLPGDTAAVADTAGNRSHASVEPVVRIESTAALVSQSQGPEIAEKTDLVSAASVAGGNDAHLRALERTHELVSLHAVRLSDSGSDSLRIAIKPGNGLHLSLDLKLENGGIAAQVALHKGDFEHLNQHWPELQKRLESQGIRLADLSDAGGSGSAKGGSQQPKNQPWQEEQLPAARSTEFAVGGSMTESPVKQTSRTVSQRGWECWA